MANRVDLNLGAECEVIEATETQLRCRITVAPTSPGTLMATVTNSRGTSPPVAIAKVKRSVGRWLLNEGEGTTANDLSANGNDLTLNQAGWDADTPGIIAGPDGCLCAVAASLSLQNAGATEFPLGNAVRSVAFWFKFTGSGTYIAVVWGDEEQGSAFYRSPTPDSDLFSAGGGSQRFSPAAVAPTGAWHHCAITWDGTTFKHYQDGVLADTYTPDDPLATNAGALSITLVAVALQTAKAKDVRIYDSVLTAAEIAALAGV